FVKINREYYESHKHAFESLEMKFVNDSVVSTYCNYLENYNDLDDQSLNQIVTMFHRIGVRCKSDTIFFK
ncbi:6153_t:CDS:2, partial [Dentiscutata erythropus]